MTAGDERARLRREVARRHHPDLGGDPDEFIRAMRSLSAEGDATDSSWSGPGRSETTSAPNSARITTTVPSRARRLLASTGRRLAHHVRTHLPRSVPGSRRYGRL